MNETRGPRPKHLYRMVTLMLAIASTTASAADKVQRLEFRESAVYATFQHRDPSGCIVIDGFLAGSISATRPPSGGPLAAVVITKFDYCNGLQLLAATGDVSTIDFHVDPNLDSARLRCTVPVYDFENDRFFDVNVDVSWVATGGQTVGTSNGFIEDPDVTIRTLFQGKFRPAQATGTIAEGSTNFTPLPSIDAQIQKLKLGEITITTSD